MKKIIILSTLLSLISCHKEGIYLTSENDYSVAIDSLRKYSDYILGNFNGDFLISTNAYVKSQSASINSIPLDSNYIQYSTTT